MRERGRGLPGEDVAAHGCERRTRPAGHWAYVARDPGCVSVGGLGGTRVVLH